MDGVSLPSFDKRENNFLMLECSTAITATEPARYYDAVISRAPQLTKTVSLLTFRNNDICNPFRVKSDQG